VFLTELGPFDNVREGFVGSLKDPASELDLALHASANRGLPAQDEGVI